MGDGRSGGCIAISARAEHVRAHLLLEAFFESLGKRVVISPPSNRQLYLLGQATIPSDTVCFPAKLVHGHIQQLLDWGARTIFYPCITYNLDEKLGDNHFNCPVVAYYPEVIAANMEDIAHVNFIKSHVGLHRKDDLGAKLAENLRPYLGPISRKRMKAAVDAAYHAHHAYLASVREEGRRIIDTARIEGKRIIVLAGRPYHVDPEVAHVSTSCWAISASHSSARMHLRPDRKFPVMY